MPEPPPLDEEAIREHLQRYGLSETAADTYLAVVERGSARVSTIAAAAGVSTSYVYDICDSLAADGFVTVEDHLTPTEIRAVDPADAFARLKSNLDELESAVTARYQRHTSEQYEFEVVKSRSTIGKRLEEHIDAADSEVILQLPTRRLSAVADALQRARDRDVLVLLSLNGDEYEPVGNDAETRLETEWDLGSLATVVRSGVAGAPSLLAVDQRRGLISPATMMSWDHDETRAIAFTQHAVASVLVGSYLGNYWPIGDEVLVSRPPSLPVTYRMFRPAVFVATTQLRAGNHVGVELSVRPTGTDEAFETTRGGVVDVRQNLVEPMTSDFGFENALLVDTGTEQISVGGVGAFRETHECERVTIYPLEETETQWLSEA